jgi:PAS domain S-box-containing protein
MNAPAVPGRGSAKGRRERSELQRSQAGAGDLEGRLRYLRDLVDDLDAIVWEASAAGVFTFVSAGSVAMLGITADEWLADPGFWLAHLHPDDRERVVAEYRLSGSIPGALQDLEYRFLARDGGLVWVRQIGRVVADPTNDQTVVRGIMLDITRRKTIEEQHRGAETRYRTLVEQLPAIVYTEPITDEGADELTLTYMSPQVEEIVGTPAAEWIRDPGTWLKAIHPDDREHVRALNARADRAMEPFIAEYRMLHRDGRTIWIHDESSVLYDEQGEPVQWQGVMVDITDQRRAGELERDLRVERATAQRLREVDDMKNTFLQAVSHDLRTPLAAILGLAITLGRDDIDLEGGEVHELANRIATNARKLDRLVHDLLDLDRLSRGIVEPVFKPIEVGSLIRELVEGSELAHGRDVVLDVEDAIVSVDPAKFERIVENLLGNAAKHAPRTSTVWIRAHERDGGLLVEVSDDGPGVPAENREQIFEPFHRGPASSAHAPGMGVGLSLVRRFAELQGGRAWVEERPGGGASFKVFLPDGGPPEGPTDPHDALDSDSGG